MHGMPEVDPPVPVVYDPVLGRQRSQGRIRAGLDGYPEIAMPSGSPPIVEAGAFAHEFGHLVDLTLMDELDYASENEFGPLKSWHDAVTASQSYLRLTAVVSNRNSTDRDRKFAQYLLEGRELFSRSYAQYIAAAKRSRSGDLSTWLGILSEESKDSPLPEQWTQEDFKSIATALHTLFREVKYIR